MTPKSLKAGHNIREDIDGVRVDRAIADLAAGIAERVDMAQGGCVVGIRTRGAVLAERVAKMIGKKTGRPVPLGLLDITLYRDDVDVTGIQPTIGETSLDFDINNRDVVLIDDVLFTGRTIRAALQELTDFGRPRRILLGVLIDRGHRELPIQPDVAPLNLPTDKNDAVHLHLVETDGEDRIIVYGPRT